MCFLAEVSDARAVVRARAVARGNRTAVLAVARDAPQGGLLIHNHPSGVLEPSQADLAVAARCWEEGLGSALVDNDARGLYVVVEPPEAHVRTPLDLDEVTDVLAPGGPLSHAHGHYEDRQGQREMLRRVAERYNDGGVLLVEAGTGTGKSLAYLVPAARWAIENGERTVVSTNTINLQEQLVAKDLPLVRRVLGEDFGWALVKGRGNYVSIRRALLAAESAPTLFDEDRSKELEALVEWVGSTEDGSLSDLSFSPHDDTWEEVRSDPDICLRARCPHFQACFYQRSRRRAASAQLLVVNHHLLFTDLAVRRATGNYTETAVLPAFRHVVLDEAHNVEDAATHHLGVEVTRAGLFRLLARLDRRGKGVLASLTEGLASAGRDHWVAERITSRVRPLVERTRDTVSGFATAMEPQLERSGESIRIGGAEGAPEPADDPVVREALSDLLDALARLEREIEHLRRAIEDDEAAFELLEERVLDLQSVQRRLGAHQYSLRLVLTPTEDERRDYVRWMERRGAERRRNLALGAAPIELSGMLRESLFEKKDTAILTSATLATRQSFEFLRQRVGLSPKGDAVFEEELEVSESIILSPFAFRDQTVLCVPTDLSDTRAEGDPLQEETARVTRELAELTGGGLFVLFTSHRSLRRVAQLLRQDGDALPWPLFVQGDEPRARLLDAFTTSGRGILLGTDSFWEGVDVPGRPLRGLIIQKLPFKVPTEPVTAARVEALEASGRNAFWEYILPLAALRLKQGFGRLIRSKDDYGAVLLLDDRILRRRYGMYLRDSLPDAPLVKGIWNDVHRRLADFYAR